LESGALLYRFCTSNLWTIGYSFFLYFRKAADYVKKSSTAVKSPDVKTILTHWVEDTKRESVTKSKQL